MSQRRKILQLFDEKSDLIGKKVAEGIERNRKGDAVVRVCDKSGKPIPGVVLNIRQKSHEFRFGANLFVLDELETREKNEAYKRYFAELFNMATLPFYWNATEPQRGFLRYAKDSPRIYRRPPPDLCIEFCEEHGIEPREHALAYDGFFPEWLYKASVQEVKRELERRFAEISERYAAKIPTIEVTNEMEWDRGRTAFYDERDYVEWCFKKAEKYFPHNKLCINEHTPLCWGDKIRAADKYYAYIEANLLKGARIDAIGMQYHLFNRREREYEETRLTLDPERIYRTLDLYSDFGKPIQITEITVPAYSWEKEDEEVQADLIEKLYSVWFSHPSVEQIIYWNVVDGYAYLCTSDPEKIKASQGDMTLGENYYHAGLLRFDLTPKPAYFRIRELTQKRWNTKERKVTDADGFAGFRGFYGNYEIEAEVGGRKYKTEYVLSKKAQNDAVTLRIGS